MCIYCSEMTDCMFCIVVCIFSSLDHSIPCFNNPEGKDFIKKHFGAFGHIEEKLTTAGNQHIFLFQKLFL